MSHGTTSDQVSNSRTLALQCFSISSRFKDTGRSEDLVNTLSLKVDMDSASTLDIMNLQCHHLLEECT